MREYAGGRTGTAMGPGAGSPAGSRKYVQNVRVGMANRAFIGVLRTLFRRLLGGLRAEDMVVMGRGMVLCNLFFQKVAGLNKSSPFLVHFTSKIVLPDGIRIEAAAESSTVYTSLAASNGCYLSGLNGIVFGKGARFAPGVQIISANHDLRNLDAHTFTGPIEIGEYSWLGANAVVLPGVRIGKGAVIGAGSVVTKDVPDWEIWAGVPAVKIGFREPPAAAG